ncbi:MAG: LptF/LptG family permease [Archangium sp.]
MKIFERYVAQLALGIFGAVALGMVALFVLIDFGDWVRVYIGRPVTDVIALYWYRSHLVFVQLGPAALVLACGLTITVVRRRGEWTALRALGASPITLLRPVLVVAVAASVALLAFEEFVVGTSGERADRIMVERFDRWGDFMAVYSPRRWFKAGDALVNVRGEFDEARLQDVRIFQLGARHELVAWTEAASLTWVSKGKWRADGARMLRLDGAIVKSAEEGSIELSLALASEVTQLAVGRPEWMPLTVLVRQVELMRALELPTEATRFAIHRRGADLVATIIAALMASLLGLRARLKPSIPRTLLEGAGLCGGLFVTGMMSRSLAINSRLPPFAAAWLVPVILLAVAVVMLRRTEAIRR